jgi:hypothetical protein
MSAPAPQPIAVNFNVVIDASGNLEVFNAAAPVVGNVIVAEHTLPVYSLYDPIANKGLLELWEPESAQGDIYVQLADTDRSSSGGLNLTSAYQVVSKAIAAGLEEILCDKFDCSGAAPFSSYTGNVEYYKQRDFGRVALATYAHHLFGHVDATAAITNDKAFVEAMLSTSAGGDNETVEGAAARYAAWTKSTIPNVQSWDVSSSSSDANLALRLVKTLVAKGLDANGAPLVSAVSAGNPDSLANIVSQVVGQDATRLMNVDNSQRTRDQHILLRFYPGDVIYMNITLKAPNVSVGLKNQLVSKAALESMYPSSSNNFTLKITLAGPTPDYIESVVNDTIQSAITSPSTADITQLKAFLGGFTNANPAPAPTITVENAPISAFVTNAAGSFDTTQNYEVNLVLLTNNTGVINTVNLTEGSVLYIPSFTGTPVALVADGTVYTITATATTIIVNGVTYNLGQKVTIGNKTFLVAFTGSIGLMVQNASPGIAKMATYIGGSNTFTYDSTVTDSLGNVYIRYSASSTTVHTIYNYSSAPVNGGAVTTTVYGTISGGVSAYLVKYNSSGQVQWATACPQNKGGVAVNSLNMVCDSENNVYLCGMCEQSNVVLYNYTSAPINGGEVGFTQYGYVPTPTSSHHYPNLYLVKYTSSGSVVWGVPFQNPGALKSINLVASGTSVYVTFLEAPTTTPVKLYNYASAPPNSNGSVGLTLYGIPVETNTEFYNYIIKYNSSGQIQYVNRIHDTFYDGLAGLVCDSQDNLYFSARYKNSTTQITFNNPASLSTLGGAINFTQSKTMTISEAMGIAILKFDSLGNIQSGSYTSFIIDWHVIPRLSVDAFNNVYLVTSGTIGDNSNRTLKLYNAGSTTSTTITPALYGSYYVGTGNKYMIFIIKLSSAGQIQWATQIEGNNAAFSLDSVCDSAGNLYIGWGNNGSAPKLFNYTSPAVSNTPVGITQYGTIASVGNEDAFLVKYNLTGTVAWATSVAGLLAETSINIALGANDDVFITGTYASNPLTINNYVARPATITGPVILEPYGTLPDVNTSAGNNLFLVKYGV